MKTTSTIFSIAIFLVSVGFTFHYQSTTLHAQITNRVCGCGSPKCTGCLKGKLFPVTKKVKQQARHKNSCGCSDCAKAEAVGQEQVVSDVLISQEFLPASEPTVHRPGGTCRQCGKRQRPLRSMGPSPCDCDFCQLHTSQGTEEKQCFDVKQKEVCVPPVRLPWSKSCPPTRAKIRVVNVLNRKSVQCPTCRYDWKVYEPGKPATEAEPADPVKLKITDTPGVRRQPIDAAAPIAPSAPKMMPKLQDPAKVDLNSVPRPPIEK